MVASISLCSFLTLARVWIKTSLRFYGILLRHKGVLMQLNSYFNGFFFFFEKSVKFKAPQFPLSQQEAEMDQTVA